MAIRSLGVEMNFLVHVTHWLRSRPRAGASSQHPEQSRAEQRIKRYREFDEFREHAAIDFNRVANNVPALKYFRDYYSFAACPGGADGGTNDRIVDVILGHKPFDANLDFSKRSPTGKPSTHVRVEQGASLRYHRLDTGRVLVFLYPARTEERQPHEDFILLAEIAEPASLRRDSVLGGHLRWLAAYMAHTSLDGAITTSQRVRVAALWLFYRRYEGARSQVRRVWIALGWISKWVATVGLSGLILFFIQSHWPPVDTSAQVMKQGMARAHDDSIVLRREVMAMKTELSSIRAVIGARADSVAPSASTKSGKSILYNGAQGEVRKGPHMAKRKPGMPASPRASAAI